MGGGAAFPTPKTAQSVGRAMDVRSNMPANNNSMTIQRETFIREILDPRSVSMDFKTILDAARDLLDAWDDDRRITAEFVRIGLDNDGSHHKQWALAQIAGLFGIYAHDKGIAP